jgi:hypothetical protein
MSSMLDKQKKEIIPTWIPGQSSCTLIIPKPPGTRVWFGQAIRRSCGGKARRHSDKKAGDLVRK